MNKSGFHGGYHMNVVLGVIIIIVGFIMVFKPTIIWRVESSLFIKYGEPTKLYYIVARVSGILAIAVGVLVILYA